LTASFGHRVPVEPPAWLGPRVGRKAVLEFFTDGIQFWNPGDSFADEKHLLDPGEKDVRNPAIAMAIRRIGMCEQAGTGLRMMQREWRALGHAMPVHTNDRARKSFTTFLPEPRALGESTPQVTPGVTPEVTPEVGRLVDALDGAMSRAALMAALGLRDEKHFRTQYQQAAVALGLVEMTIPDKPNSRLQRYRLTDAGKTLRARRDADR
jgi:ATP-dependent DNA helicase RecG